MPEKSRTEPVAAPGIYLYKQILEAKLFIDAHFREKIDLGAMAHHACFSKFHFHRTFKECYGKTPLAYLTYLRLKAAKIHLAEGVSTRDACYLVGYESVSSFIKLFKKNEAMTPAEYGKMALRQKAEVAAQPLQYIPVHFAEYLGWTS